MGYKNGGGEAKLYDEEAQSGLGKEEPVLPGDAMLTEGRGGQRERGLRS